MKAFLTEEKAEEIKKVLIGLNSMQWEFVKRAIDSYYNKRASKIIIEDSQEFDNSIIYYCLDKMSIKK